MSHVYIWGPNQFEDAIYQLEKMQNNLKFGIEKTTNDTTKKRFQHTLRCFQVANLIARHKINKSPVNLVLNMGQLLAPIANDFYMQVYIDGSEIETNENIINIPPLRGIVHGVVADFLPVADLGNTWNEKHTPLIIRNVQMFEKTFNQVGNASVQAYQQISCGAYQIAMMCTVALLLLRNQFVYVSTSMQNEMADAVIGALYREYGIHLE